MDLSSPPSPIDGTWIVNMLHPRGKWGEKVFKEIELEINSQQKLSPSDSAFDEWKREFCVLYPEKELDISLYSHHCLLVLIIATFLHEVLDKGYGELHESIETPPYFRWMEGIPSIVAFQQELVKVISQSEVSTADLFGEIYQDLIANSTRHVRGEFYTPPNLCRLMVDRSYQLGMTVLDPACGSGSFLVSVIQNIIQSSASSKEKSLAFSKIYGVDINPVACMMSRTNLLLSFHQAGFSLDSLKPNIVHANMLLDDFSTVPGFPPDFSLIIGNPPWLVVNGIPSKDDKERLKQLGNDLCILRGGKLATSTELTALFWAKLNRDHIFLGGIIHMVIPASLATGAQHALLRQFVGWQDIEFWDFDQDLFRIHSLCIKACKGSQSFMERLQVRWTKFHYSNLSPHFTEIGQEIYVPSIVEIKKKKRNIAEETMRYGDPNVIVGRFIPLKVFQEFYKRSEFAIVTDTKSSPYVSRFRQGASLVPRNLLFVDIVSPNLSINFKSNSELPKDSISQTSPSFPSSPLSSSNIHIQPALSIQSKKYSTWEFKAYSSTQIEPEYIFSVAKSTGLLSFYYLQNYKAVLPLERSDSGSHASESPYILSLPTAPLARAHISKLQKLYTANIKPGAKISQLFDRLNYGKALTDHRQFKTPKVIFAGIGSNVKAAILEDHAIIDTSLYFYIPESRDEAYYLMGILNSPLTTEYLHLVGSTGANGSLRNIHKYPLHIPFPQFEPADPHHRVIIKKAKKIERSVHAFVSQEISQNPSLELKIKTLQNRLLSHPPYQADLRDLNELVRKIIHW
ncbi:MAG: HsdM family class I SAM-dependent methyltransferase [Promethearchaeota archaeon]